MDTNTDTTTAEHCHYCGHPVNPLACAWVDAFGTGVLQAACHECTQANLP